MACFSTADAGIVDLLPHLSRRLYLHAEDLIVPAGATKALSCRPIDAHSYTGLDSQV